MKFYKSRCPQCGRLDLADNISDTIKFSLNWLAEEPEFATVLLLLALCIAFSAGKLIFG